MEQKLHSEISVSSKGMDFTGSELCRLQAHEVVELLQIGEISTSCLVNASRLRVEAVEPAINAIPTTCWQRATEQSEFLDSDTTGQSKMLSGVPIAIKDLTPVDGVRTTYGSVCFADNVPAVSDPLVCRLEANGGIIVGKSNTPEWGAGGNTFNDVFGPTLNPWDTNLNAGGSSGGAAAALAAGEVWLAHGSDHAGSLRTPAAYCGVVGMRVSPGRIGRGLEPQFLSGAVDGPMARSVRDCALLLDAMTGFTPSDPLSFPSGDTDCQRAVIEAEGKLKIAFSLDLNGAAAIDSDVRDHLLNVLHTLERNGSEIDNTCPALTGMDSAYRAMRGAMYVQNTLAMPAEVVSHLKSTLKQNVEFGQSLGIKDIAEAQRTRSKIYSSMVHLLDKYDVFACPTVGCMPHPQDEEWVREVGGHTFSDYIGWLQFSFLATITGLPAISVPVGFSPTGLPVGIQLIGRHRGERELLSAARIVEMTVGGPLGPIDPNVTHQ